MASISNNTNIPLGIGATFEGLYEDLSAGVESIQINIKSDQSGVFRVFFAITPTVLLYEKSYTYLAGEFFFISVPKIATYFRCNYTNGATAQTTFQLRTTFNGYLLVDEPTSGTGAIVQVSNFPATQTIDGSVSVSGVIDTSGSSVSVSNFPASQTIAGTVSISGIVDTSGSSVSVSNFPATQPVSISGTIPVENATGGALVISKGTPAPFSVYTGAIASIGTYGNVDLNGYSSFDLLISQTGGSVSVAGSLYVVVSNDGINWFVNTSTSAYINVSVSNRSYLLTYPSLNSRYVGITTENPFGGSGLTTTSSTITLSAKR